MKTATLLILLCCGYASAQDNDPFDKTRRQTMPAAEQTSGENRACIAQTEVTARDIPFDRLKIVGTVQYGGDKRIFFADENRRLFSAGVGQFIGREELKIDQIDKREIRLLGRQPDCSAGKLIAVKF